MCYPMRTHIDCISVTLDIPVNYRSNVDTFIPNRLVDRKETKLDIYLYDVYIVSIEIK